MIVSLFHSCVCETAYPYLWVLRSRQMTNKDVFKIHHTAIHRLAQAFIGLPFILWYLVLRLRKSNRDDSDAIVACLCDGIVERTLRALRKVRVLVSCYVEANRGGPY